MIKKNAAIIVLALCVVTYLLGIFFIPLMDIDAAQYASISREMLQRKSFLQLYDLGRDYLDKPPMLFWLSALSMRIFGVHDWAYRLPSFLFSLLSIYSTYRLALLYYKKEVALLGALVLATSQAMFLINHDVRTDTMLMGWVIFSIWQLAVWYQNKKWKHFFLAFLAIAGGMMTKGPIALMVPAFALIPHFALRKEWKQFFRWEYIPGIIIIAIALLPMSIGLYQQYDLHPGKIINGVPIQSGLRFYYWTQSFGRYTGENVYREMNEFTFLLQNMLWSFLPWIIFFLIGLLFDMIRLVQDRFKLNDREEWISTGGFTITYCVLARSQAQLPHYIFVVFPLAAIITAKFLYRLLFTEELKRLKFFLSVFHVFIFTLLWVAVIILMAFPFPSIPKYVAGLAALCLVMMYSILYSKKVSFPNLLEIAFFTVIGVNVFLNTTFYPTLLGFQMGNTAADFINKQHIEKDKVVISGINPGYPFHFYGNHIFSEKKLNELQPGNIVVTSKDSLMAIQHLFPRLKVLYEGNNFHVTQLSLPFLNPATRPGELEKYEILALDGR